MTDGSFYAAGYAFAAAAMLGGAAVAVLTLLIGTADSLLGARRPLAALAVFGVDERGLDKVDRAILSALCERFGGGPVGLSTLAISVAEPTETVEDVYEPFLIREGLLMRTPRGRVATPAAWEHLGLSAPRTAPDREPPAGLFG